MKIPSNKVWTQLNEGEVTGVLHNTRNIALDTIGQAKLAKRPVALASSINETNFAYPMSIVYFDNAYSVVTTGGVYQGHLDGNNFVKETTFIPNITLASDSLTFKDATTTQLIVTTATNFARWDGSGSVSYSLGTLTTGVPHPLCIFDSNPTYKLAIGNGNLLHTYDKSYNLNPTILTLASQFIITTLRYRNGYIYIGTKTTDGTEARVFIWNGSGTNAQYECPVGCEWVFAMTEYGSSVAAIVSSGELIQISGSQYIQLATLPVFNDPHAKWQGAAGFSLNGKVFNRGIGTVGQNIYINVDGDVDVGFIPEMKSGIWVYEPNVGLYHRATSTTDTLVRDSTFTFSTELITTSSTHNLKTGDGVQIVNLSTLTGVDDRYVYYVTVISPTTIKLSLSREGVQAQRYVQLSGSRTSERLVYYPNTDSGNHTSISSGALSVTTINETAITSLTGEVIWGCRTNDQDGTGRYVLNGFHDSNNIGHLMTQRIYTDNIEQTWKEVYTFLDGIVTENDEIIVKVQIKVPNKPMILSGVWLNTSTINLNDTDEYPAWGDIKIGDELVFTNGYGQGKSAHVTGIDVSALTYSLTLDEAIGTINKTNNFYFTNFRKVGAYGIDQRGNEFIRSAISEKNKSPWIKIKCELRGADIAVNMFELANEIHKGGQ